MTSIPVGCVLPAFLVPGEGGQGGLPSPLDADLQADPPVGRTPSPCGPVKTLPCSKLHLRAVNIINFNDTVHLIFAENVGLLSRE